MGVGSGIGWTDNTFNPWWGCQKVSPACDHCYAEAWAKKSGYPDAWNGKYRFFGDKHWNEPLRWQKKAKKENRRVKVFCASMADVFDNKVPGGDELRTRLFQLIKATPNLDWQLLTKRIGNVKNMLPDDWDCGYKNVWLGITVVNQDEADRDVPKLLQTRARVRWLSVEPMLGPMDMRDWLVQTCCRYNRGKKDNGSDGCNGPGCNGTRIDWVVTGFESDPERGQKKARPGHPTWAVSLRDQCKVWNVPFFHKQNGEWTLKSLAPKFKAKSDDDYGVLSLDGTFFKGFTGWNGRDIDPDTGEAYIVRAGIKNTGKMLDGKEYTEFPHA